MKISINKLIGLLFLGISTIFIGHFIISKTHKVDKPQKLILDKKSDSKPDSSTNEAVIGIDSVKIKSLDQYFIKKNDEFSNKNIVWYYPKSKAKYINQNAIYCYFCTENAKPTNFRLVIQYASTDWLFIEKVLFNMDGTAFSYFPAKFERDNNADGIWEWSDEQIQSNNYYLIYGLSTSAKVDMKLVGSQYHKIKTLTKGQILDIKRTLNLYEALGGKF